MSRCLMMTAVLCGFLAAMPMPVMAQSDTVHTVQTAITNKAGQKWVFKRIEKAMGPVQSCKAGTFWRFLPAGKLIVSTCVEQRWVETSFDYRLRQDGPIDVVMTLTGKGAPFAGERRVRVVDEGRRLVIRAMSATKDVEQEDLIFSRAG